MLDLLLCFVVQPVVLTDRLLTYPVGRFGELSGASAKTQIVLKDSQRGEQLRTCQMSIFALLLVMQTSTYVCIMYRHQAVLPARSVFKVRQKQEEARSFRKLRKLERLFHPLPSCTLSDSGSSLSPSSFSASSRYCSLCTSNFVVTRGS